MKALILLEVAKQRMHDLLLFVFLTMDLNFKSMYAKVVMTWQC